MAMARRIDYINFTDRLHYETLLFKTRCIAVIVQSCIGGLKPRMDAKDKREVWTQRDLM